jgi:hypothetical protein
MPLPQNREEMLLALALETPVEKRAALLDATCAGDPASRRRLEALLAAQDKPEPLPPSVAPAAKATIKLDLAFDAEDEAVGKTIGRYKVLEKGGRRRLRRGLCRGANEPVRRRVALKVIKLGMDTKQVIARFRGGAPGAGHDGSSQHRQGAGCGRDRNRPPVSSSWNWCAASRSPITATSTISHQGAARFVHQGLSGDPARASKGHHSPRHQTVEYLGHDARRCAGAKGD